MMAQPTSPFFGRTYGAFTKDQVLFIGEILPKRPGIVVDPMAGQGATLASIALAGDDVWIGDLNPATRRLAALRDPVRIAQRDRLAEQLRTILRSLPSFSQGRGEYSDDWIPPRVRAEIDAYLDRLRRGSRIRGLARFGEDILVLAARDTTAFRASDNVAWNKPGGLDRGISVREALESAVQAWHTWATQAAEGLSHPGRLHVEEMDPVQGRFSSAPKADLIVTSPPYANRLDYSRLWGPEIAIAEMLPIQAPVPDLARRLMGSNSIRGRSVDLELLGRLPLKARRALEEIRLDLQGKASAGYYYPFFAHYLLGLFAATRHMARRLRARGQLVVFVRDTVRRDILVPAAEVVRHAAQSEGLAERRPPVKQVIRGHIGLRRRGGAAGVFGLAQQEWWLSFARTR